MRCGYFGWQRLWAGSWRADDARDGAQGGAPTTHLPVAKCSCAMSRHGPIIVRTFQPASTPSSNSTSAPCFPQAVKEVLLPAFKSASVKGFVPAFVRSANELAAVIEGADGQPCGGCPRLRRRRHGAPRRQSGAMLLPKHLTVLSFAAGTQVHGFKRSRWNQAPPPSAPLEAVQRAV
jgi:hypothetical protein